MDINLLTKMLTELILRHDKVGLPGLGRFVAEEVGASFSNNGFTVNPPYRRLSFVEGRPENNCLIEMYANTNGIDLESAERVLSNYMKDLKETIIQERCVVLPGLGKLRATRENGIFFVPDENLDIYPMGFGLESGSLKSHSSMDHKAGVKPIVASKTLQKVIPVPVAVTKEHENAPEKVSDTQSNPIPEQAVQDNPGQTLSAPAVDQDEFSKKQPAPVVAQGEIIMEQPAPAVAQSEIILEQPATVASLDEAGMEQPAPAVDQDEIIMEQPATVASLDEAGMEPPTPAVDQGEIIMEQPASAANQDKISMEQPTIQEPANVMDGDNFLDLKYEPVHVLFEEEEEDSIEYSHSSHVGKITRIILVIIVIAMLLLAAFLLLAKFAPDFIDSLLYTAEERAILNFQL